MKIFHVLQKILNLNFNLNLNSSADNFFSCSQLSDLRLSCMDTRDVSSINNGLNYYDMIKPLY